MTDVLFSYDKDEPDVKKMATTIRFLVASNAAKTGVAGWVNSVFARYNDPKVGAIKAKEVENYFQSLIDEVAANPQSFGLAKFDKEKLIKLTGSNPFSSAFRKGYRAMSYGGDFIQPFRAYDKDWEALDTMSKCETFSKHAKEIEDSMGEAAKQRKQAEQVALSEGLVADTPEFNARVSAILGTLVPVAKDGDEGVKTEAQGLDVFSDIGREYGDALREIGKLKGEEEALKEAQYYLTKVKNILNTAVQQAAAKTGLTNKGASAA